MKYACCLSMQKQTSGSQYASAFTVLLHFFPIPGVDDYKEAGAKAISQSDIEIMQGQ